MDSAFTGIGSPTMSGIGDFTTVNANVSGVLQTGTIARLISAALLMSGGQTADASSNVGVQIGSYRDFLTSGAKPVRFMDGTGEMASFGFDGVFSMVSGTLMTNATTTNLDVLTAARLPSGTLINSTTVCLSDGTNCPASGGGTITSSTWQYNLTNATIFPTTSTFDVLIGGNTTATAGIVLDGAGTSTFANRVSSTGFIAGIGTQTAPSYGFTGYGGGLWSGGADLRIVTNDLIIRNIADTVTAFRVAGGLATFSVIPTPASHNAYNIGFVNTAWKNIYASGTLFAVGGQFSLVTSTQATTTWLNVGTTARLPADSLINGTTVCLSNGTNCPAGGSQDLQSVTGFGATTTDRIYTQGGIETPSIGINTDDTSVYELNVNGEANFDALVRMSNDLNVVDASENPIFVVRPLAGTPAVGILTEPSELGEALAVLGTVSSSDMIVLNDVVVAGQSVCLENGTNCPVSGGSQTLAQTVALGSSATGTLQLYGGLVAASSTVTSTFTVLGTTALLGNVGVRTANPEGRLHVSGAANERLVLDNGMIISQKNTSGVIRNIFTLYSDNNVYFDSLDGDMFLRVGAGLNKGITVLNGGNVGIGTLAPSVALDVNGSVSSTNILTGAIYARTNNIFNIGSPTSSFANIYASGTAFIEDDVLVSGQSVCLADGTNCPSTYVTLTITTLTSTNINVRNIREANGSTASSTITLSGRSAEIDTSAATRPTSSLLVVGGVPRTLPAMNATSVNCVYWGPEFIRDAWDGLQLKPTISWTNSTGSGAVVWRLRVESISDAESIGTGWTGTSAFATGTAGTAMLNQNDGMNALTVGGATTGTPMRFELCRNAAQAGDTLGTDAFPNSLKIEYGLASYSDN